MFRNTIKHAEGERVASQVCLEITRAAKKAVTLIVHSVDGDWGASHSLVTWKQILDLIEAKQKKNPLFNVELFSVYYNKSRKMLKNFKSNVNVYPKVNLTIDVASMYKTLQSSLPFGAMDAAVGFLACCCDYVPKLMNFSSADWWRAITSKSRRMGLFDTSKNKVNPVGIFELYHTCAYLKLKSKIKGLKQDEIDCRMMMAYDYVYGSRFSILDPLEMILRVALICEVSEVMIDSMLELYMFATKRFCDVIIAFEHIPM